MHGRRRSGTRVVNEVVTCGHTMGSATSRRWGSTRMRMVQLASSRSTTAGVRFLRRTQRRVVPSELTRMCLASPRRVGWVTAGKGQRRASSGADDGVTTRTKTFVLSSFDSFCCRKQSCKDCFRVRRVRVVAYREKQTSRHKPNSGCSVLTEVFNHTFRCSVWFLRFQFAFYDFSWCFDRKRYGTKIARDFS